MDRTILTDYTLQGQTQNFTPPDDSSDIWIAPPSKFPKLSPEAMPGWIGDFVNAACEHSEADPAAVLFQSLTGASAMLGNRAIFHVGDKVHYARLFALVYGESAKARKGTSFAPVERLLKTTNALLKVPLRMTTGPLSTGEGLVYHVRDASEDKDKHGELTDPGVSDKRILITEEEFASALRMTKREGNSLSTTLRSLWDSGDCEPLTKGNRIKTTGAHVAIIGHITPQDLKTHLRNEDVWNGFANRFLFACARRRQLVARPKAMPTATLAAAANKLRDAATAAMAGIELHMSQESEEAWEEMYPDITAERGGVVGVITARAEAHILRLSAIYALLDHKPVIAIEHLLSASAAWQYCLDSAHYIFGSASVLEDETEHRILNELSKQATLSQTEVHKLFNNHLSKEKINGALATLEGRGAITRAETPPSANGGRKTTSWTLANKV